MRNNSGSKKRCEYEKYIESRVLISSNSVNPLSKNISSKLDLIKQELSRQFHQKFETEKKSRNKSVTRTVSGSKQRQNSKANKRDSDDLIRSKITGKKLNFNEESNYPRKTEQNIENGYRQKYYEIQQKLLAEKERYIEAIESQNNIKQEILNFLEQPTTKNCQPLKIIFQQRYHRSIDRIISLEDDVKFAENTLNDLMILVDVEDIQSLLGEVEKLAKKQNRKTADDYTFKILELQTKCNKLDAEYQENIQGLQAELVQLRKSKEEYDDQVYTISEQLKQALEQNQQTRQKFQQLYFNIIHNSQNQNDSDATQQKAIAPSELKAEQIVRKLRQKFSEMENRVRCIEKEAEENMEMFMNYRNDMNKLEQTLDHIKEETQLEKDKLASQYSATISMKQQEIMQLQGEKQQLNNLYKQAKDHVSKLLQQNLSIQSKIEELKQDIDDKQSNLIEQQKAKSEHEQAFWKAVLKIRDMFLREEIIIEMEVESLLDSNTHKTSENTFHLKNKLNRLVTSLESALKAKIQQLNSQIIAQKSMIQWQQKELSIKESLLEQFDFNLKKLVQDADGFQNRQKDLKFERDEYRFLLENTRGQIIKLKSDHQSQLQKAIEDKDKEYLTSNKEILEINSKLEEELYQAKVSLKSISLELDQKLSENNFYRKKAENQQVSIIELENKVQSAEGEASRCRKCLEEIQISFREVEKMSDMNAQKMNTLQNENKQLMQQIKNIRTVNTDLEKLCTDKNQKLKELSYSCDESTKKLSNLLQQKEAIEESNSDLRIKKLEISDQMRTLTSEVEHYKGENIKILRENNRLSQEINEATRKLIRNVDKKDNIEIMRLVKKKLEENIVTLKRDYHNLRQQVQQQIQSHKTQLMAYVNEQLEMMIVKLVGHQSQPSNRKTSTIDRLSDTLIQIKQIRQQSLTIRDQISSHQLVLNGCSQAIPQLGKIKDFHNSELYDQLFKIKLIVQSFHNQIQNIRESMIQYQGQVKGLTNEIIRNIQGQQSLKYLVQPELKEFYSFKNAQSSDERHRKSEEEGEILLQASVNQVELEQKLYGSVDEGKLDGDHELEEYYSPQFPKFKSKQSQRMNQGQDEQNIRDSKEQSFGKLDSEAKRVNYILASLKKNSEVEVSYFSQIRAQYDEVRKRINHKVPLNLDISGVSYNHNTHLSSPTSINFYKDFLFDNQKRMNSESNEDDLPKSTNRSDQNLSRVVGNKQGEFLKNEIIRLEQYIEELQARQQEMIIRINQLDKKNTYLENQMSQKTIEKLFSRFIEALVNQKVEEMEMNCRILMKVLGMSEQEMKNVEQYCKKKKKEKEKSAGLSGLFKNKK